MKHCETIQLDLKKLRNTYTRQPSVNILEVEEVNLMHMHTVYYGNTNPCRENI